MLKALTSWFTVLGSMSYDSLTTLAYDLDHAWRWVSVDIAVSVIVVASELFTLLVVLSS